MKLVDKIRSKFPSLKISDKYGYPEQGPNETVIDVFMAPQGAETLIKKRILSVFPNHDLTVIVHNVAETIFHYPQESK